MNIAGAYYAIIFRYSLTIGYEIFTGPVYLFLKEADHYDNFNCHALGIAKVVVCTSENMEEQDYDVIVMSVIFKFNDYRSTLHHNSLNNGSLFF